MVNYYYGLYENNLGTIYVVTSEDAVVAVHIGEDDFIRHEQERKPLKAENHALVSTALTQLGEYFSGSRQKFDLPLTQKGTPFQLDVWETLINIPFGETRSYQDIAKAIGKDKAVRAIGQANKANQLPIIVPCHRVIGKNLRLTGYAGTRTDIKEVLLTLEGAGYKK